MMGKRILCTVASVALAAALSPTAALAADLAPAPAGGWEASAGASPQAAGDAGVSVSSASAKAKTKTKTVYVLTSIESKDPSGYSSGQKSVKYNSKRLVRKVLDAGGSAYGTVKLAYNAKNVPTSVAAGGMTTSLTATATGKIRRTYSAVPGNAGSTMETTRSLGYANGRVASCYTANENKAEGWVISHSNSLTYNGKGLPVAVRADYFANDPKHTAFSNSTSTQFSARLKYDKRKNLVSFSNELGGFEESSSYRFKNKYDKNGNLVKRVAVGGDARYGSQREVLTYKYKAVRVPAKMASRVEAQQWALLNGNMNFSLSGRSLGTNWDTMTGLDDYSQLL